MTGVIGLLIGVAGALVVWIGSRRGAGSLKFAGLALLLAAILLQVVVTPSSSGGTDQLAARSTPSLTPLVTPSASPSPTPKPTPKPTPTPWSSYKPPSPPVFVLSPLPTSTSATPTPVPGPTGG